MIALLVGIVFVILGVLGLILWWGNFVVVLTGSLPPIFILSGLAALALGISQVRDKMAAKKEEEELAAEEAKAAEPKPEPVKPEEPAKEPKPPEPPKEEPKPQEPGKKEEGAQ
jgi:outer membrane biosynthesis protein TonB